MNGRGRGATQMVLGLLVAERTLLCPALAHQQPQEAVVLCSATNAHALRLCSSCPSQKLMSHTIFQFLLGTSLYLESCWPRHLIHIGSRF